MPDAATYRVPVPRTRNEPKSATVARARVPPYFRRRYGGRRVPPRRGGSTHTKYRRYTNSTRRAYLRGRSAQSLRKTGSRSRNCTCTVQFRTRTVQFRTCTVQFRTCTARTRTVLEFRDREQVRRHERVTRGVPYRRSVALCRLAEGRRGGTRRPPYLRRKYRIPAAETYRVPVPRTRNELKSITNGRVASPTLGSRR